LPKTSPRGQHGFLKLLTRIDLAAAPGLQFVGQVLSPGAFFAVGDLPCPAVLLEYAGRERIAPARSRYSFADLWIVWYFDFKFVEWVEVARTHSQLDSSWTHDMAFLAHKRLFPNGERPAEQRAQAVIEKLEKVIGRELENVNADVRPHVVAALDVFLAREIVRVSEMLTVGRTRRNGEIEYPRIGTSHGSV
jgi:hypothetical protein